jgi:glyoxylase-like metal-dependent hydrolase (beta-lactamase superfamily II)
MAARPSELGGGRLLLDLEFRDTEGLVASYALPAREGWYLVETGPTTARAHLLAGLSAAGIAPGEVAKVFVTHIHLDHAGGVGALADALPNARFYAHRAGVPHLVDPGRLVASARRAWGAAADPLWGPIVPVLSDRITPLDGGERFELRDGSLEVLATPGHARHHLAFLDTSRRAVLTGDAAGVHLPGSPRARPAVPAPDLDLGLLYDSLDRMAATGAQEYWYTHFGPKRATEHTLAEYRAAVEAWREVALRTARSGADERVVAAALREYEEGWSRAEGRPLPDGDPGALVSGYDLAAQGLLRYLRTRGELPPEGS